MNVAFTPALVPHRPISPALLVAIGIAARYHTSRISGTYWRVQVSV